MKILFHVFMCLVGICYVNGDRIDDPTLVLNKTRRILRGNEVEDTRPYMVYLRPSSRVDLVNKEPNWLCGGAIIHPQYILTSAACIEDINHFYVISGTYRWLPINMDDECIKNGARKAVWKCVPKDYVFDGKTFDNIRWMMSDIAVVKVEDEFNFEKRVRGCDFIPQMVGFNNKSIDLEAAGTVASTAGWGSTDGFGDLLKVQRSSGNSPTLLETDVVILSKKNCKKRWPERYHHIIDNSMICGKDGVDTDSMSALCREHELKCKELVYSDEEDEEDLTRRFVFDSEMLELHSGAHLTKTRRSKSLSGGFCENDHGGPLVVGHGSGTIIIGIISACMSANITQKCYGPFLYTSVWRNRHLISCAIDKEKGATCRRLLRSGKTGLVEKTFSWRNHPDGPAKTEKAKPLKPKNIERPVPNAPKRIVRPNYLRTPEINRNVQR